MGGLYGAEFEIQSLSRQTMGVWLDTGAIYVLATNLSTKRTKRRVKWVYFRKESPALGRGDQALTQLK
jgi:hypothetical protein